MAELYDVMSTLRAVRKFRPDPIPPRCCPAKKGEFRRRTANCHRRPTCRKLVLSRETWSPDRESNRRPTHITNAQHPAEQISALAARLHAETIRRLSLSAWVMRLVEFVATLHHGSPRRKPGGRDCTFSSCLHCRHKRNTPRQQEGQTHGQLSYTAGGL